MKPGIYRDLDANTYHADPCEVPSLNQSTAKVLLNQSEWHAWEQHPRLGGASHESSKAMDAGTIAHALLLGQPLDNIRVIDAADFRTNDAKQQRKDAYALGKTPVLEKEYAAIMKAVPVIQQRMSGLGYEFKGSSETTMIWNCEGTLHRCRADHLEEDDAFIIDLKSTADANPQALERLIITQDYHLQAAAEIEALETLRPELVGRVRFVDIFFELEEPYWVVDVEHSEAMLDLGRARWRRARKRWQECLDSNVWPGYKRETGKREPLRAYPPRWAQSKEFGDQL